MAELAPSVEGQGVAVEWDRPRMPITLFRSVATAPSRKPHPPLVAVAPASGEAGTRIVPWLVGYRRVSDGTHSPGAAQRCLAWPERERQRPT